MNSLNSKNTLKMVAELYTIILEEDKDSNFVLSLESLIKDIIRCGFGQMLLNGDNKIPYEPNNANHVYTKKLRSLAEAKVAINCTPQNIEQAAVIMLELDRNNENDQNYITSFIIGSLLIVRFHMLQNKEFCNVCSFTKTTQLSEVINLVDFATMGMPAFEKLIQMNLMEDNTSENVCAEDIDYQSLQ